MLRSRRSFDTRGRSLNPAHGRAGRAEVPTNNPASRALRQSSGEQFENRAKSLLPNPAAMRALVVKGDI